MINISNNEGESKNYYNGDYVTIESNGYNHHCTKNEDFH